MSKHFDQYSPEEQNSLRTVVGESLSPGERENEWRVDACIRQLLEWGECGVSPVSGAWVNSHQSVTDALAEVDWAPPFGDDEEL